MRVLKRIVNAYQRRRQRKAQPLHEERSTVETTVDIRERVVASVIQKLRHEDPDVRLNAVKQLEEIGDPAVVEPLVEALEDENWGVRNRVAWALGQIGDAYVVAPLIGLLGEGNGEIKIYVQYSLLNIRNRCQKAGTMQEFEKNFDDGLAKLAEKHPDLGIPAEFVELKNEIENRKG